jgi:ribosomal protein S18 acetylase RimI-like enzyme
MFHPITDADVPAIVSLINRAYRGARSAGGWTTETAYLSGDRTSEALVRADLRDKPAALFLKWLAPDGALHGCVWLEPLGDGIWYLGSLAADPERQNAGLGRTLLAAAEQWVRAHGGTCIRMTVVNVREALIAWYHRRGYSLTGVTEPFPYGDNRFGIPLRDDLAFLVLEKRLAD